MAGEFSDVGSSYALDAVSGRATVTTRTMYLALLRTAPTDTTTLSTMAEYDATGYSRQTITFGTGAGAVGAPSLVSSVMTTANTSSMTFGPFTANGTNSTLGTTAVPYAALVSAASGTTGDLVAYWTLDTSRTPALNDAITVAVAQIKLQVD